MKRQFQIVVNDPCGENWDGMRVEQKGRFCDNCLKTVIDFTAMTNQQVHAVLNNSKEEVLCGRFKQSQVNAPFSIEIDEQVLYKRRSFKQAFLLSLFVVMGTTLFSCKDQNGVALREVHVVYKHKDSIDKPIDSFSNNRLPIVNVEAVAVKEGAPEATVGSFVEPYSEIMGTPAIVPYVEVRPDSIVVFPDSLKK